MHSIETMTSSDLLHPLQTEMRHDDQSFAMFALAKDLERSSHEPYVEGQFNPYHKLQEVMFNYVGDPNIQNREGVHELPGVVRETRNGTRNYTLGCAALFNPETAELCIVRKDPNARPDATDWFVIRYNITSGNLREEIVQGASAKPTEQGDDITLELVQDKDYHGPYQLKFSVNQNYSATGLPAILSHKMYYGRGTGPEANSMIDAEYTEDIGVLFEKINFESRQRAYETQPDQQVTEIHRHTAELHRQIGYIADKAA